MLQDFRQKEKTGGPENHRGKMRLEVIAITWPAFIELVLSTLFGMVDMIMVGQLSPAAIAAVGITNQPFMLLLAVFAAVNVGTTTLVAWNIGANNIEKASSVTRQVLVVNAVLGILTSLVGILSAHYVVTFMGAEAEAFDDAVAYFRIVCGGLLFQGVCMGVTASLRGAGQTKLPMYYNLGANLFNVFGNYVLIYGKLGFPQLGVSGAAISTTVSRFLACAVGLCIVRFSKNLAVSIRDKGKYKLDMEIIKRVFSIGLPAAFEQCVLQSGLTLFAKTVSGLGTADFAAHQIGLNISGLTFSPSMAFGVASTTLVGQSLGANDAEKARKYADIVHHMAICVACFIGSIYILFSHHIARLYTQDPMVAVMAGTILKILALSQPGQSTQLSISGALRGAGDTMYPLYASIFGIWGFRVIIAHIFVNIFKWGLVGAWLSLALDQYTRATVVFLRFRTGKWKCTKARSIGMAGTIKGQA
ncbi:MAG: MATE family efflux transporter [Bacillota bacterium]